MSTPTIPEKAARNASDRTLSVRALATPEPLVRAFARRVQQEGALDLTQGDYKNADFAPHPEVVRAAQRITRRQVRASHHGGGGASRTPVRSARTSRFSTLSPDLFV